MKALIVYPTNALINSCIGDSETDAGPFESDDNREIPRLTDLGTCCIIQSEECLLKTTHPDVIVMDHVYIDSLQ